MTEVLITLISTIAGIYVNKHVQNRNVKAAAKQMLEAVDNNITDPTVALREAWVQANSVYIKAAAAKLTAQAEAGKIRIAASEALAKENARGIDAEIIPRDGTEEFKQGWPLK